MAYKGCCKIYFPHAEQFAEPFPCWYLEAAELEKLIFFRAYSWREGTD